MVWPLSWGKYVRVVFWLEREVGSTVLEGESTSFRNDGSTKTSVVGHDETASVAFWVGTTEVDCIGGEG